MDIYGKAKLPELLENLCKIEGIKWIRFLYTYPETITDELIQTVKKEEKICKYFDIPIQHISNKILKRMNRHSNKQDIEKIVQKLKQEIPNVIIRTTLIVGFPGETGEDFEELYQFVQKAKFDKLGCFTYSKEDGTPAAKLPNQIHYRTKKSRHKKIMETQKTISKQNLEHKLRKRIRSNTRSNIIRRKILYRKNLHGRPRRRRSSIHQKNKRIQTRHIHKMQNNRSKRLWPSRRNYRVNYAIQIDKTLRLSIRNLEMSPYLGRCVPEIKTPKIIYNIK